MMVADYILAYSGKPKDERAKAGVGLLLHKRFQQNIDQIDYINEKLLRVTLKHDNGYIQIISAYAPDISKPKEERRSFYEELQSIVDLIPSHHRIILMGDLNARVGNEIINGVKQRFNEHTSNDNGDLLTDFCAQNNFRINNTYFDHNLKYKYTFMNSLGQQSVIDYIITNRLFLPTEILDVRTLNSANIGSDHALLLCKVRTHFQIKRKETSEPIEKLNIESLSYESTRELYCKRLQGKIDQNPVLEEDNVETGWNKLKVNIMKAVDEAIGRRKIRNTSRGRNKTPWLTDEFKEITKEKKEAFLCYKSSKTTEDRRKYIEKRNQVNLRVKQ